MKFLIIPAAVLLLVTLLLIAPAGVRVIYNGDGDLIVRARIGPISVRVYPIRRRKIRLSKFSGRGYKELMERESENRRDKQSKKDSDNASSGIRPTLQLIRRAAEEITRLLHGMKVTVRQLRLTVAGESAAGAAIIYGGAVQTLAYVTELIGAAAQLSIPYPETVGVSCSFCETDCKLRLDIEVRARIIRLLAAAVRFFVLYSDYKDKNSPKGKDIDHGRK